MNLKTIDAIIFDLGGVLINLDYQLTTKAFEDLGLTDFSRVYSQLSQSSLFDDYETGKISSQRFINELLPFLPNGRTPNQIVQAWNAMILDVPKRKLQLLDELRKDYKVFLLSNTNEIHMQKVRREWSKVTDRSMESFFDRMFLSCEIGLRKPNKEVFHFVSSEINTDPSKTLFIDDSPQHIEGAIQTGLNAIHLTDSEKLYAVFS